MKLINGLYRGVPIVTTHIGIESTLVENGIHVLVSDKPYEYTRDVIRLMQDKFLWLQLSTNARKLASKKYKWTSLYDILRNELKSL